MPNIGMRESDGFTAGAWVSINGSGLMGCSRDSEPSCSELQGKGLSTEHSETLALVGNFEVIFFLTCLMNFKGPVQILAVSRIQCYRASALLLLLLLLLISGVQNTAIL